MYRAGASRMSSVLGLKARPQSAKWWPFRLSLKIFVDLGQQVEFLPFVDVHDGVEDLEVVAHLLGGFHKGLDIFWKAAAAIADAGEEEAFADAFVAADASSDHVYVGAKPFAEQGDFVHKGDLGSKEGIGGVFGELGGAFVHVR